MSRLYFLAVVLFCAGCITQQPISDVAIVSHCNIYSVPSTHHLLLPFAYRGQPGDQIFLTPNWGVKVESVAVDGKMLVPYIHSVKYVDLPTRQLSMHGDTYVYKIHSDLFDSTPNEWVMYFFHSHDKNRGVFDAAYRIPTVASTIEVMYRVRMPDSTESRLYKLICDRWKD